MNARWQRRLHSCVRALGWTGGVAVILLAVLMALPQLLLPLLGGHPDWVAGKLSEQLQRPVSFTSMDGRWTPAGPLFVMHGVVIGVRPGDAGTPVQIPEASLKLDFGGWLAPSRHLVNLHVRGLQLAVTQDAGGAWHVNGIGVSASANRRPLSLGPFSIELWLENLQVLITQANPAKSYTLLAEQLRLSYQGEHIRFGGRLRRDGVAAVLHTAGRFRKDGSAGRIWIGVSDVDLKPLLRGIDVDGYTADQGHGQLAAWLNWHHGKLASSTLRIDLDRLSISHADGARASVSALHATAGLQRLPDGYDLRWAGDDGSALALTLHQAVGQPVTVGLAATEVQLGPLLPWLALKPDLAPAVAQWVGSGHPRGNVNRVSLQWNQSNGLQDIDLTFTGLGIDAVGRLPGLSSLNGVLRGDTQAFSLELPPQSTSLRLPQEFSNPITLDSVGATLALWPDDGDWHFGVDTLEFIGPGFGGDLRGELTLPAAGGAPFVELYATINQTQLQTAKQFLPSHSMPASTVAWLKNALVAGSIDQAQVLFRGSPADWPFRHNEGRFEARAAIRGLTLNYNKQWPAVEEGDVTASLVNNGLMAQLNAGRSLDVKVDKAVALIPDFADPLLDLNLQGSGSVAGLMGFVRKSPIGLRQADMLGKLNLAGNGTFDFHLALPLARPAEGRLNGTAQLKDASFSAPEWNLRLDKINGPLQFDGHGMQGGPLSTVFRGQPSTLQLAVAGGNADPNTAFFAKLSGRYQFSELVQDYPSLAWLGPLASGRSDFSIGYTLAHAPSSSVMTQTLLIDSPLSGIALDLPAPLKKAGSDSMPLHVGLQLPIGGSDVQVALGQALRGRFRLGDGPQKPFAATLALGSQMPMDLPAQGLRIRGNADQLDVAGWVQRAIGFSNGGGGDGPSLESIDVTAAQALVFGYSFGTLQIRAKPKGDALSVDVDGTALSGNISVPSHELAKRGITARLSRLFWPKDAASAALSGANAALTAAVKLTQNAATQRASATPPAPAPAAIAAGSPANTGINPAALPPFHLWLGELRLGDAKLGDARLETWPIPTGLHIDQLQALSSRVQITASGDWTGTATNSNTHMRIGFAADDLGAMLGAFGFEGLVNGGKTNDQLDAKWPGAPSALSLASMTGTLGVKVNNGRIPDVSSPGAGRLLGLASITELPRRLSLDFGDVFGKGLSFDSMTGDFQLANGVATTSNFKIHASAAEISISGSTDLRAKTFDQQLVVVPHVGNSLPIVGAVVAGPLGAAAGFAVQGLLGKGLNKAAGARYRITGKWDKPVMTLVEKHSFSVLPRAAVAPMPINAQKDALPASSSSAGR